MLFILLFQDSVDSWNERRVFIKPESCSIFVQGGNMRFLASRKRGRREKRRETETCEKDVSVQHFSLLAPHCSGKRPFEAPA